MKKKYFLSFLVLLLAAVLYFGSGLYQKWLSPNVVKNGKLYIPTHATYQQVLDSLKPFLNNEKTFDLAAKSKNFPALIKPGRYSLRRQDNNKTLLRELILGRQDEIAIRIGNYTSIFQLAGRVAPLLECDSSEIVRAIEESEYSKGYDTAAMIFYFLPNTYNFHWNTSGKEFVEKMKREFDKFWTTDRLQEAKLLGRTPFEIITLASIVQLESAKPDEQPRVAGLYLNRLKIGMKLDADPTVIYAMKKENPDQNIQRVYYKDLNIASPYNTYLNNGLPPGPICMPNPSAIDAVLNPAQHDFLYFVADPARPGYHIYASTLREQEQNAAKYRAWLNKNEIK
jgi:UPF0755 protein